MSDIEDRVRQALQDRALEPDPNQLTPEQAGWLTARFGRALRETQAGRDIFRILRKLEETNES